MKWNTSPARSSYCVMFVGTSAKKFKASKSEQVLGSRWLSNFRNWQYVRLKLYATLSVVSALWNNVVGMGALQRTSRKWSTEPYPHLLLTIVLFLFSCDSFNNEIPSILIGRGSIKVATKLVPPCQATLSRFREFYCHGATNRDLSQF